MRLIQWKNNAIEISPEAYGIKAFREIWQADASKDKSGAILELSVLYFMYDPRSDFMHEIDLSERLKMVKEETGVPEDWEPNELFTEAVRVLQYLTNTTSAMTLESNRKVLKKVDVFLDNVEINDKNLSGIIKAIKDKNDVAIEIAKAEKEIYGEIEERSEKMRGSHSQTIGDTGLAGLFS